MHRVRQENLPFVGSSHEFVGEEQGETGESKRDSSTAQADGFAERTQKKRRRPAPFGMTI